MTFKRVSIIGGCGHVGLPLGMIIADRTGAYVDLVDVNGTAIEKVRSGVMPFMEDGADELLRKLVDDGVLNATSDPSVISEADAVIVVIGTEVDRHLKPETGSFWSTISSYERFFVEGQLLIVRSTVFPGTTNLMASRYPRIHVACCPERTLQGRSLKEIIELPQVIGADDDNAINVASDFFSGFVRSMVQMRSMEAELLKLFTNSYRYLNFAISNQFYAISASLGLNFDRIRSGMMDGYPRMSDFPSPGFAAGPCLFKDTMQLAAFADDGFAIGHAGMVINEGLPRFIVRMMEKRFSDLRKMSVALLGMSFKADTDDNRESLSYSLKRFLELSTRSVACSDPYVKGALLVDKDEAIASADIIVIGAPHSEYRSDRTSYLGKPVVDIWGITGQGIVL